MWEGVTVVRKCDRRLVSWWGCHLALHHLGLHHMLPYNDISITDVSQWRLNNLSILLTLPKKITCNE